MDILADYPEAQRKRADDEERWALQRYWHDKLIAAVVCAANRRERAAARRAAKLEHWS